MRKFHNPEELKDLPKGYISKENAYILRCFLVGLVLELMGYPICDNGHFNIKNFVILIVLMILFDCFPEDKD